MACGDPAGRVIHEIVEHMLSPDPPRIRLSYGGLDTAEVLGKIPLISAQQGGAQQFR